MAKVLSFSFSISPPNEYSGLISCIPMKPARDEFAAAEVCVNHPNATARVIEAVMNGIEKGALT